MPYKISPFIFAKPRSNLRERVNQQLPLVVKGLGSTTAKMALILCSFLKSIRNPPSLFVGGSSNVTESAVIRKASEKINGRNRTHILKPAVSTLGNGKSLDEGLANLSAWHNEINHAEDVISEKVAKDRAVALIEIKSTGSTSGIIDEALSRNIRHHFTYSISALLEAPKDAELCVANQPEIEANMANYSWKRHLNLIIRNSARSPRIDVGAMADLGSLVTHTYGAEDYELSDLYKWLGASKFWEMKIGTINNPLDFIFNPFPIPEMVPNMETTIFQASKIVSAMQYKDADRAILIGTPTHLRERIEAESFVRSGFKLKLQTAPAKIKDKSMNLVAGKLSPYQPEIVDTPHFRQAKEIV